MIILIAHPFSRDKLRIDADMNLSTCMFIEAVLTKLKQPEKNNFKLTKGKQDLDMANPLRFAGLKPNSTLTLVQCSAQKKKKGSVNVKVEFSTLEKGSQVRLIKGVDPTLTLFVLLLQHQLEGDAVVGVEEEGDRLGKYYFGRVGDCEWEY